MSVKNLVEFSNQDEPSGTSNSSNWTVLSVEDDDIYQKTLKLCVNGLKVQGKNVEVLTANSAIHASAILSSREDITVILLDVVMESDDAGLRLVDTIRNIIGNHRVRIILLTGQPSMAPHEDIMKRYDIDEYWVKTEVSEEQLRASITSNIRTWRSLTELYNAKRGLQMLVDASRVITSKRDIHSFTQTVLGEIGKVIGVPSDGGIVCVREPNQQSLGASEVVAASGHFSARNLSVLNDVFVKQSKTTKKRITDTIESALKLGAHAFSEEVSALYFSTTDLDNRIYIICVQTPETLNSEHIALLQVFCENIGNGFTNLALLNKLSQLAYYDSVLNIPNRNWLEREISQIGENTLQKASLVLVDIKGYAENAVMFGKDYSESMVSSLYRCLRFGFPSATAICRVDNNQLALLFLNDAIIDITSLQQLAERSIRIDGVQHTVLSTICEAPLRFISESNASDIITMVQIALADAREKRVSYTYFDAEFTGQITRRYLILQDLYQALLSPDVFSLALQPKVNMVTGELVGAEALLRWTKADGSIMPPSLFIPIAEASGLITKIDLMVMEQTLRAIDELRQQGVEIPISFNVTYSDICDALFVQKVESVLRKSLIPRTLIEIEITETEAMEDYKVVNPILKKFEDMGVRVSIDDFGTGYSSLSHITDLAISTLKLDRMFISKLSGPEKDAGMAVCEMVLRLAKRLNFNVIAEGVETEQERDLLLELGYEIAQGYLYGKPMTLKEFLYWNKTRER